ncbi:MAG: LamG-like jellyroll fold domain-containing protein [Kofleriaceae bacterium]
MTYDGAELIGYLDGVAIFVRPVTGTVVSSPNPVHIGADSNRMSGAPNVDFVDGDIDNVRIESVSRSPAWIRADFLSANGELFDVGSEERR